MDKRNYLRIGDIAFRVSTTIGNNPKDYVDIIKIEPNQYYGKESEYIKEENGWYSLPGHPNCHIDPKCFENFESCYSLATMDIDDEPTVKLVGLRILDLESEDFENFRKVLKLAYQYSIDSYIALNHY